ncbi:hypothetical protein L873DRAFT_786159 [Choiromyces venosus 120613-1]|uniref:Uncharacterized protein n=1 Tax=Choiromyces venosus 120613-1 TaxID=1336337 RepID=A0A3N4K7M5_9PEZI|nr:hypothetical protein L873DRAFT_786159 [Choiromyces venosus 120613-1]
MDGPPYFPLQQSLQTKRLLENFYIFFPFILLIYLGHGNIQRSSGCFSISYYLLLFVCLPYFFHITIVTLYFYYSY